MLEECVKSADRAAKRSDAKYGEVVEKLQKSEKEKILLMRQKCQTSNISKNLMMTKKNTYLQGYHLMVCFCCTCDTSYTTSSKGKESWFRAKLG